MLTLELVDIYKLKAPSYSLSYKDFDVAKEYHEDWDRFKIWDFNAESNEPIERAYSMANCPDEKGIVMLNVRIASPHLVLKEFSWKDVFIYFQLKTW